MPDDISRETISVLTDTKIALPQKRFIQSPVIFFSISFILITASVLLVYFVAIRPYQQKQQEEIKRAIEVQERKQKLLAKVDLIIAKVQNPDPNLVIKYQPVPDLMKIQQDNTVYGAKLDTIVGAKFLPNSLTGVRAAIEEGNFAVASERILKVFPEVTQSYLTQDRQKPDRLILQKEELDRIDPDQVFSPASKLDPNVRREVVSAIKKEAVIETIALYYTLSNLK